MSYSEDIEPWLGDHVALFFRSFRSARARRGDARLRGARPRPSDADAAGDFLEQASNDASVDGERQSTRATTTSSTATESRPAWSATRS